MFPALLSIALVLVFTGYCQAESTVCSDGTFGWKCKFNCACQGGSCDLSDGSCQSGCQEGRYGFGCQLDDACMYDARGVHYTGSVHVTGDGEECLKWSDPTVTAYRIGANSYRFPVGDDPQNYCRNPQTGSGQYAVRPWCFVSTAGEIRPSYCNNITLCGCPDGLFGLRCNKFCRCNKPEDVCNKQHGSCSSGCAVGWTGLDCQRKCDLGQYGIRCSKICEHSHQRKCNPETGKCLNGCDPGYRGTNCSEKCPDGVYGRDCAYQCGNCSMGENCNIETGVCSRGCADGFTGKTCSVRVCPEGRYGANCSMECDCDSSQVCHEATGICLNVTDYDIPLPIKITLLIKITLPTVVVVLAIIITCLVCRRHPGVTRACRRKKKETVTDVEMQTVLPLNTQNVRENPSAKRQLPQTQSTMNHVNSNPRQSPTHPDMSLDT